MTEVYEVDTERGTVLNFCSSCKDEAMAFASFFCGYKRAMINGSLCSITLKNNSYEFIYENGNTAKMDHEKAIALRRAGLVDNSKRASFQPYRKSVS